MQWAGCRDEVLGAELILLENRISDHHCKLHLNKQRCVCVKGLQNMPDVNKLHQKKRENGNNKKKKKLEMRVISCHKTVQSLCEVSIVITLCFWKVTEIVGRRTGSVFSLSFT